MKTYENLVKLIKLGRMPKEEILEKIDIFLLNSRITDAQYGSLVDMLNIQV